MYSVIHTGFHQWVPPFGYLRVTGCCRLTEAFRRLPRPSSPLTAKASTVCAFFLSSIAPNGLPSETISYHRAFSNTIRCPLLMTLRHIYKFLLFSLDN